MLWWRPLISEEVVVGIEDCPIHGERNNRLRFADSSNLPGVIGEQFLVNGATASAVAILGCGSLMLRAFQHGGAGGRTAARANSPAETRLSFHCPCSFVFLSGYFAATGS
jgi:hypothetical protein